MVERTIFSEFKPVVKPREYVRLIGANNVPYGFFKVKGVEPIGEFIKDFGLTISAGSESKNNEFTDVYMEENVMAQWRIWVLDDVRIKLNLIGRSQTRGTTKYVISTLASFSMDTNDNDGISQFFTFQDEKVYLDIENPTQSTSTYQRVRLMGYKYTLEKIDYEPDVYTDIPIAKIV